jgi:hydrogenase/urease accessory protein HupE
LDAFVAGGVSVRSAKGDCGVRLTGARLTEQDGLALSLAAACPATAARYDVELPFLRIVSVGHRHLATWHGAATDRSLVAYESSPAFALERSSGDARSTGSPGGVAWPLFRLGVEHILTGYDHLLFLFGLILVGGTLRELLVVVTAFTLAHSITLALAALGVVAPSPAIVEPAIALSIAYVGVENWFVKDAARRWLLTFPFGLIHGFGFAAALQEISLPKADIPLALVSFNLGVEAGQVAVLALVLPLLLKLRRRAWFVPVGVRVLSSGIACAGLVWFVLRVS